MRVTAALRPHEPVLQALLALLLLQHSRRDARVGADGRSCCCPTRTGPLAPREVAEAVDLLQGMPSPVASPLAESYRLQALVAAEHATARAASDTRWDRVCDHYAALVALNPSPAVRLAAAVALAERDGPPRGWRPSTAWTTTCRAATGCRPCAASCSRGRVSGRRRSGPRRGDRALRERRRARPPQRRRDELRDDIDQ